MSQAMLTRRGGGIRVQYQDVDTGPLVLRRTSSVSAALGSTSLGTVTGFVLLGAYSDMADVVLDTTDSLIKIDKQIQVSVRTTSDRYVGAKARMKLRIFYSEAASLARYEGITEYRLSSDLLEYRPDMF